MTESKLISRVELLRVLEVDDGFLVSLEQEQIVVGDPGGNFTPEMVERIRVCLSLYDLGVNLAGLDVALRLLDTIAAQRRQFREVLGWVRQQLDDQPG